MVLCTTYSHQYFVGKTHSRILNIGKNWLKNINELFDPVPICSMGLLLKSINKVSSNCLIQAIFQHFNDDLCCFLYKMMISNPISITNHIAFMT